MKASAKKPKQAAGRMLRAEKALAKRALAYPEVDEEAPWGHRAFKVKGKTFLFLANEGGALSLSTKLPSSATLALALPFAEPTRYGLGKSGWVSARFAKNDDVPVDLLEMWIDESYRAIAPKKLLARIGEATRAAEPAPKKSAKAKRPTPRSRAATKRTTRKR